MPFKINIAEKTGKTWKLEIESEALVGKQLHDKIPGKDIHADLEGYEFEITGASDKAGFTSLDSVEGIGLKKVLLSYEKGMHKRPKYEGKKKRGKNSPKGLRLRKTVRGKVISQEIVQINLKIIKDGSKKLSEIFADQNQPKEPKENRATKRKAAQEKPKEAPKEETNLEEKPVDDGSAPSQPPVAESTEAQKKEETPKEEVKEKEAQVEEAKNEPEPAKSN